MRPRSFPSTSVKRDRVSRCLARSRCRKLPMSPRGRDPRGKGCSCARAHRTGAEALLMLLAEVRGRVLDLVDRRPAQGKCVTYPRRRRLMLPLPDGFATVRAASSARTSSIEVRPPRSAFFSDARSRSSYSTITSVISRPATPVSTATGAPCDVMSTRSPCAALRYWLSLALASRIVTVFTLRPPSSSGLCARYGAPPRLARRRGRTRDARRLAAPTAERRAREAASDSGSRAADHGGDEPRCCPASPSASAPAEVRDPSWHHPRA